MQAPNGTPSGRERLVTLLDRFKADTITLEECLELQHWITAIQRDEIPSLENLKLLVSLVGWSLGDKIIQRGGTP